MSEIKYFILFEIALFLLTFLQITFAFSNKVYKKTINNNIKLIDKNIITETKKEKKTFGNVEEKQKDIEPVINVMETKIEKKEIIEIPKIINNQIQKKKSFMPKQLNTSIEFDDADIIWFEE